MKTTINENLVNGWKKETWTSYNFLEELEAILKHFNLKIGNNKHSGVEFVINNNGGELNLVIPNFMHVHLNIAFEINHDDFFKFSEYAEQKVKNLINRVDVVSEFLEGWK